jgi:hypothetical protein
MDERLVHRFEDASVDTLARNQSADSTHDFSLDRLSRGYA